MEKVRKFPERLRVTVDDIGRARDRMEAVQSAAYEITKDIEFLERVLQLVGPRLSPAARGMVNDHLIMLKDQVKDTIARGQHWQEVVQALVCLDGLEDRPDQETGGA